MDFRFVLILVGATIVTYSKVDAPRTPGVAQTGLTLDLRARSEKAAALMTSFAERTGLSSERPGQRYLWTDAFAVCNFLGLAHATGEARYAELAQKLIDRVHHTLGQRRPDDEQRGWLSGLLAHQAEAHPTRGGLRIGKKLPERRPSEPFDEGLEWDQDGQYFHYLTKWMHALDQASRSAGRPTLNLWARELAETAHRAFVYTVPSDTRRRMYWKMSIDLARPLVRSMGHHDPLDGYITCAELQATASKLPGKPDGPSLENEARSFASMVDQDNLATADPLGLGGLLVDAHRVDQLARQGAFPNSELRNALLRAALAGLEQYVERGDLQRPAEQRLAFRELGLAIGLHAAASMREALEDDSQYSRGSPEARALLEKLGRYDSLRGQVVAFWLEPEHRKSSNWTEHRDINDVMLATALAPEGFLALGPTIARAMNCGALRDARRVSRE